MFLKLQRVDAQVVEFFDLTRVGVQSDGVIEWTTVGDASPGVSGVDIAHAAGKHVDLVFENGRSWRPFTIEDERSVLDASGRQIRAVLPRPEPASSVLGSGWLSPGQYVTIVYCTLDGDSRVFVLAAAVFSCPGADAITSATTQAPESNASSQAGGGGDGRGIQVRLDVLEGQEATMWAQTLVSR